jgi:hypothetical protein
MRTVTIKALNCFPDGISVKSDTLVLQKKLTSFVLHPVAQSRNTVMLEIATVRGSFVVHDWRKRNLFVSTMESDSLIKPAHFELSSSSLQPGTFSFELVMIGRSGYFLRHCNRKLEVSTVSEGGKQFAMDTCFYVQDVAEQRDHPEVAWSSDSVVIERQAGTKYKNARSDIECERCDDPSDDRILTTTAPKRSRENIGSRRVPRQGMLSRAVGGLPNISGCNEWSDARVAELRCQIAELTESNQRLVAIEKTTKEKFATLTKTTAEGELAADEIHSLRIRANVAEANLIDTGIELKETVHINAFLQTELSGWRLKSQEIESECRQLVEQIEYFKRGIESIQKRKDEFTAKIDAAETTRLLADRNSLQQKLESAERAKNSALDQLNSRIIELWDLPEIKKRLTSASRSLEEHKQAFAVEQQSHAQTSIKLTQVENELATSKATLLLSTEKVRLLYNQLGAHREQADNKISELSASLQASEIQTINTGQTLTAFEILGNQTQSEIQSWQMQSSEAEELRQLAEIHNDRAGKAEARLKMIKQEVMLVRRESLERSRNDFKAMKNINKRQSFSAPAIYSTPRTPRTLRIPHILKEPWQAFPAETGDKALLPRGNRSAAKAAASLGTDNLADGWRMALSNRPQQWSEAVKRVDCSSEFWFGSLRVSCKSLGLNVIVQLPSKERMTVDKFLDKFGPQECANEMMTMIPPNSVPVCESQIFSANPEENANC